MACIHGRFYVKMYRTRKAWRARRPYKVVESDNLVLNLGAQLCAYLFSAGSIASPGSTIGFDDTTKIGVSDQANEPEVVDAGFVLGGGESAEYVTVEDVPVWDGDVRSLTYTGIFGAGVGSFVWKRIALLNSANLFFDISAPLEGEASAKGAAEIWEGYCVVYF